MPTFSDEHLMHLNQLGLIPGPKELPEEFADRANYCLTLKEHLSEELKVHLGAISDDSGLLKAGGARTKLLYGIAPSWIPVFFSNYKLAPWHGGCAWIFQMTAKSPTAAFLQLRQSLHQSPRHLGLYHRDELIAHELVHVGRMAFEEPRFEEILAYRTSSSAFRRYFGPIIQSPFESTLLVFTLALICFVDLFFLSFYDYSTYFLAMWLKLVPAGLILIALVRLAIKQRQFRQCIHHLEQCVGASALSVAYRLTDAEIKLFAKESPENSCTYAKEQAKTSLRWRLIWRSYFCEENGRMDQWTNGPMDIDGH